MAGHLDPTGAHAANRLAYRHATTGLFTQRRREQRQRLDGRAHQNLGRNAVPARVRKIVLGQEGLEHVALGRASRLPRHESTAAQILAVPNRHQLHDRDPALNPSRHHVDITLAADDILPLLDPSQACDLIR